MEQASRLDIAEARVKAHLYQRNGLTVEDIAIMRMDLELLKDEVRKAAKHPTCATCAAWDDEWEECRRLERPTRPDFYCRSHEPKEASDE